MHGQGDVRFDYDGALHTASQLWLLADTTDNFVKTRDAAAEDAVADWQGPYRADFLGRVETEEEGLAGASTDLRNSALQWAKNWADAVNQTNKNRRARKVTEIRNKRGGLEKVADAVFFGDDSEDQVRAATVVSVPQPPGFAATGGLDNF